MAILQSIPATPDVAKLRQVVSDIDCMSQDGFSKISTVAKLALSLLETPEGHSHLDDIATALELISCTAENSQDCINSEAETVGCNYIDEAQRRRWAAALRAGEARKELQHG